MIEGGADPSLAQVLLDQSCSIRSVWALPPGEGRPTHLTMDLGGASRTPLKRSQPPLDRNDDPKRAKRVGGAPKLGAVPAPFDLANVLSGASDAARIRQQYVIQLFSTLPDLSV